MYNRQKFCGDCPPQRPWPLTGPQGVGAIAAPLLVPIRISSQLQRVAIKTQCSACTLAVHSIIIAQSLLSLSLEIGTFKFRCSKTRSICKMLGPFATASRLTPIHQVSLAVLSRAACASMSTTTTTTTYDDDNDNA